MFPLQSKFVAPLLLLLSLTPPAWCAPPSGGMRGDGVADDTAALQNALDTQKDVVLEHGNYRITRPLHLTSGESLVGTGKIIVDFDSGKMDDSNAAIIEQGNGIRLEGITIAKKFIDGSYGIGVLVKEESHDIVVRDVEISGYSARYGIHLFQTENFEISGCTIHDFLMNAGADMILDSPAGIRATRCTNGVISNNRVFRIEVGAAGYQSISPARPAYGRQGYQSDCLTIQQCRAITLTGNVLETTGEGIDLLLSQECTVSGNSIRNIWFQGIKLLGVKYSAITGNALRDCLQGIGLAQHVAEKSDCVGNTVIGNTILDSGAPGQFQVPSKVRQGLADAVGIDLTGRCLDDIVAHNVILDTQAVKTMKAAVRKSSETRSIVEGNSTGTEGK